MTSESLLENGQRRGTFPENNFSALGPLVMVVIIKLDTGMATNWTPWMEYNFSGLSGQRETWPSSEKRLLDQLSMLPLSDQERLRCRKLCMKWDISTFHSQLICMIADPNYSTMQPGILDIHITAPLQLEPDGLFSRYGTGWK